MEEAKKSDQMIARACKTWRECDRQLIGAKGRQSRPPQTLVDAEWQARQNMRKVVDDAEPTTKAVP